MSRKKPNLSRPRPAPAPRQGYGLADDDVYGYQSLPSLADQSVRDNYEYIKAPNESTFFVPGHQQMDPRVLNDILNSRIQERRRARRRFLTGEVPEDENAYLPTPPREY